MADENTVGQTPEPASTVGPADAPAPIKRRGPRRKANTEGAGAAAPAVKSPKGTRGRRGEQAAVANTAAVQTAKLGKTKTDGAPKGTRKYGTGKRLQQSAASSSPVIEDVADLLQLEEENKRLRKTLAEKLRAENADLRKKLGLG